MHCVYVVCMVLLSHFVPVIFYCSQNTCIFVCVSFSPWAEPWKTMTTSFDTSLPRSALHIEDSVSAC